MRWIRVIEPLLIAVMMTTSLASTPEVRDAEKDMRDAKRSKPDLERGARLFQTCAACHGLDGGGAPDGRVPRIAGQHASVLITQLVDFRHDHRWDPQMEHFADWPDLPDPQAIADVAGYVSRLDGAVVIGSGDGEELSRGRQRYTQLCLRCHGAQGEGQAPYTIPRLAGQHYGYLERQIYDAVDGRRPNLSLPHVRLLARLDRDDIKGIADYLSRLPGKPGDGATSRGH